MARYIRRGKVCEIVSKSMVKVLWDSPTNGNGTQHPELMDASELEQLEMVESGDNILYYAPGEDLIFDKTSKELKRIS